MLDYCTHNRQKVTENNLLPQMTIFRTLIPILMHSSLFSLFYKQGTFLNTSTQLQIWPSFGKRMLFILRKRNMKVLSTGTNRSKQSVQTQSTLLIKCKSSLRSSLIWVCTVWSDNLFQYFSLCAMHGDNLCSRTLSATFLPSYTSILMSYTSTSDHKTSVLLLQILHSSRLHLY